jgi:hypothetical protein
LENEISQLPLFNYGDFGSYGNFGNLPALFPITRSPDHGDHPILLQQHFGLLAIPASRSR